MHVTQLSLVLPLSKIHKLMYKLSPNFDSNIKGTLMQISKSPYIFQFM